MATIDSTAGAFLVGLVTSMHCMVMCGPIACAWAIGSRSLVRDAGMYHVGRLASYTILGCIAGAVGTIPLTWMRHGPVVFLPWLLVLVFLGVALGLDRWMPKPLFLSRPIARLRGNLLRVPAVARAGLLGAATPLLPCGPLYLMLGLAMANGSAALGARFALAFGLGTLPLLWMAQTQAKLLPAKFGPNATRWWQRGLALCAALVMAWRLRGTFLPGDGMVSCH